MTATTLREDRAAYFDVNGFGDDGGYSARWAWFKIGPLSLPVPNTASRVYAVRYHDLHHLITGYATDWRGEFEISAWEIGAGCKNASFAWMINLGGLLGGLVLMPRRTWRAFIRGCRSDTLYGRDIDGLLERSAADVAAEAGLDQGAPRPVRESLWFLAASGLAALSGAVQAALVLGPIVALALWAWRAG